jgi:hypothetical protein
MSGQNRFEVHLDGIADNSSTKGQPPSKGEDWYVQTAATQPVERHIRNMEFWGHCNAREMTVTEKTLVAPHGSITLHWLLLDQPSHVDRYNSGPLTARRPIVFPNFK